MSASRVRIPVPHEKLAKFCREHDICRLAFFGSVLRDDFTPDSDVDVLVEFEPTARVSLLTLVQVERELGELLGRRVDLIPRESLSKYIRDEVFAEEETVYVAA